MAISMQSKEYITIRHSKDTHRALRRHSEGTQKAHRRHSLLGTQMALKRLITYPSASK